MSADNGMVYRRDVFEHDLSRPVRINPNAHRSFQSLDSPNHFHDRTPTDLAWAPLAAASARCLCTCGGSIFITMVSTTDPSESIKTLVITMVGSRTSETPIARCSLLTLRIMLRIGASPAWIPLPARPCRQPLPPTPSTPVCGSPPPPPLHIPYSIL